MKNIAHTHTFTYLFEILFYAKSYYLNDSKEVQRKTIANLFFINHLRFFGRVILITNFQRRI